MSNFGQDDGSRACYDANMEDGATRKGRPDYARRINRVLDYIDKHLDEALTVDVLSEVANFSKFHFHRQFSQHCGISLSRYVQFMRLKRAAYRLAFNPTAPIIDVALDSGFENPNPFPAPSKPRLAKRPARSARRPTGRPGARDLE